MAPTCYSRCQFWTFCVFQKENTPFRNGKSKEELLKECPVVLAVETQRNPKKLCFEYNNQGDERTFLKAADFHGNVRVLLGIEHTNNYRFDCEFVLKYCSNGLICRIPNCFWKSFGKRASQVRGKCRQVRSKIDWKLNQIACKSFISRRKL